MPFLLSPTLHWTIPFLPDKKNPYDSPIPVNSQAAKHLLKPLKLYSNSHTDVLPTSSYAAPPAAFASASLCNLFQLPKDPPISVAIPKAAIMIAKTALSPTMYALITRGTWLGWKASRIWVAPVARAISGSISGRVAAISLSSWLLNAHCAAERNMAPPTVTKTETHCKVRHPPDQVNKGAYS